MHRKGSAGTTGRWKTALKIALLAGLACVGLSQPSQAQGTLDNSAGSVADENTRTALQNAITEANTVMNGTSPSESDVNNAISKLQKAESDVTASMQAKQQADAAKQAQEEAQQKADQEAQQKSQDESNNSDNNNGGDNSTSTDGTDGSHN